MAHSGVLIKTYAHLMLSVRFGGGAVIPATGLRQN